VRIAEEIHELAERLKDDRDKLVEEWNFTSSRRLWPSGVCSIANSDRTPSSPTMPT
jgi:hypothetical protein